MSKLTITKQEQKWLWEVIDRIAEEPLIVAYSPWSSETFHTAKAHIRKFNKKYFKEGLNAYFFDIIKKAFSKYILSFYSTGIYSFNQRSLLKYY